jgi:hypothetical protein
MTDPQCDRLDEYMCGWLSKDEAAEFEAHLAGCAACQDECAVQRQIDHSFADAAARVAPLPATVADRIGHGVRTAQRRRQIGWASALAAAAGIPLALGVWVASTAIFSNGDHRPTAPTPTIAADVPKLPAPPVIPDSQPIAAACVTLVDPSSAILVPVESRSPNVTVVCVYPTVQIEPEQTKRTRQ